MKMIQNKLDIPQSKIRFQGSELAASPIHSFRALLQVSALRASICQSAACGPAAHPLSKPWEVHALASVGRSMRYAQLPAKLSKPHLCMAGLPGEHHQTGHLTNLRACSLAAAHYTVTCLTAAPETPVPARSSPHFSALPSCSQQSLCSKCSCIVGIARDSYRYWLVVQ